MTHKMRCQQLVPLKNLTDLETLKTLVVSNEAIVKSR